ncbi:polyketide cyclase [Streptomyces albus subsp. chlorinus]|uniref:SRPBCC family protein n=1 Tax=Streptomyces albus TaxID=1888 RepID=UPI00157022B9|nr:SRPBCC family protein [Streptomyces albus]NSC21568.1 polyketide cyclase [Streptomyces albus subsp. chlorinus]
MSGHTDNSIVIDAPMDLVWEMTNDVESWPRLFTEYARAEIVERLAPDTIRFRLTLHPDEDGNQWSWISDRTVNEAERTTHSKRVETGPFKYMSLFWEYTQEDEGVRLRWVQDYEMKPQAPVSLAAMTERLNTNSRIQMQHIKERVEARAARLSSAG